MERIQPSFYPPFFVGSWDGWMNPIDERMGGWMGGIDEWMGLGEINGNI